MIELYSWLTPNGEKVHIMLEEVGLPYEAHPINIGKGDQFKPAFLEISPNNRIPAIVDREGPGGKPYALFESGAILMYLAEKTGRLMPSETRARYEVIQWLMFQMGNIGPMLGQANHFRKYAPRRIKYAVERYTNEAHRLYNVVDKRLAQKEYLAGEYSIADIACWPWMKSYRGYDVDLADYPNVKRWHEAIKARSAVGRGLGIFSEYRAEEEKPLSREAWDLLFGAAQYQRR